MAPLIVATGYRKKTITPSDTLNSLNVKDRNKIKNEIKY